LRRLLPERRHREQPAQRVVLRGEQAAGKLIEAQYWVDNKPPAALDRVMAAAPVQASLGQYTGATYVSASSVGS